VSRCCAKKHLAGVADWIKLIVADLCDLTAQPTRLSACLTRATPRADKHLTGLAEWNAPSAGMFLWLKLLAGVTDADQIFELLKDARVVVVPGAGVEVAFTGVSIHWILILQKHVAVLAKYPGPKAVPHRPAHVDWLWTECGDLQIPRSAPLACAPSCIIWYAAVPSILPMLRASASY